MSLKTLQCCGDDASSQHWSVLRAIHTLNTPQNNVCLLGGLSPIHWMHRCGVPAFMWGARRPYLPAAAMGVMAVVMPVVCCYSVAGAQTTLVQFNLGIYWVLPESSQRHQDGCIIIHCIIIHWLQRRNKLNKDKSLLALYLKLLIT